MTRRRIWSESRVRFYRFPPLVSLLARALHIFLSYCCSSFSPHHLSFHRNSPCIFSHEVKVSLRENFLLFPTSTLWSEAARGASLGSTTHSRTRWNRLRVQPKLSRSLNKLHQLRHRTHLSTVRALARENPRTLRSNLKMVHLSSLRLPPLVRVRSPLDLHRRS
jgi:hypothetical protein